ncbi:STAS-like domain-containing protein [Noviherbaspirillum sp.]|uniref:STAS-like domain-containing protein n=1 Tax=Noviherbaspirillum sp. TaxID=1926288 RepID=UPI002B4777E8|nr:STAS-like domain-containing protein [Noviherbaspirillum sp.]HJV80164.1 STAS-like domain-containing protein [Noviherbaspirillum sp.]
MMTSTFSVKVTDIAPDLSTRPVGIQARERLLQMLQDYDSVEVDFLSLSLTPSFADECIGRLAAEIGLNEFKKRVKLTNVSESSKPLVKHVILTRCSAAGS